MIKKININESQSVTINTGNGWLYDYKSAFGHDILPDLLPALQGIGQAVAIIGEEADESGTLSLKSLAAAVRDGAMIDALGPLYGLELTTVTNILWALVHNADKTTPPVEDWINDIDISFDIVIPEILEALPAAMVTSKNLTWLKDMMKTKTRDLSISTSSPSEQPQEG